MLVWILLLLQVPIGAPPREPPSSVSIRARVLDTLTGAPIPGAIVQVLPPGSNVPITEVEASAGGEFQLRAVPRTSRLMVDPPPMRPTHVRRVVPLAASANQPDTVVQMDPALAISGRVVDEFDEPMANVRVIAEPLDAAAGFSNARHHVSDDRGAFRVFGLPAGRYRLCAVPQREGVRSNYSSACQPAEGSLLGPVDLRHGVETPPVTLRTPRSSAADAAPPGDVGSVTIRGRVIDNESGAGVPRALLSLSPAGGGAPKEAIADPRGEFELRVPAGPYDIRAAAGEFKTTHVSATYRSDRAGTANEILIMPGDSFGPVEIRLHRAAAIWGTVANDLDEPLADAAIEVVPEGRDKPLLFEMVPTTDDRGEFRVHGIAPGRYTICAGPRPPGGNGVPSQAGYARGCSPFAVNARGESRLSTLRLERRGKFSISGRVVVSAGRVPPDAWVTVTRIGDRWPRPTRLTPGPDGTFVAPNLAAGAYALEASAVVRGGPRAGGQWAAARVEILHADIAGVMLQLSEGRLVRGRVIFDDPADDRRLGDIEIRAVSPHTFTRAPSPPPAETDDAGEFVVERLFGPAVLRVRTPIGHIVKSIRYAGRDILDVTTEFDSAALVEIVLSRTTAQLSGRVFDDLGRPSEDAGVLYFPADPARWQAYEGGLRQQSIGGRYRIENLAGGDYLVIAVSGPRPGWTEKDYAALAPLAERVTLADGERRALDLRAVTLAR